MCQALFWALSLHLVSGDPGALGSLSEALGQVTSLPGRDLQSEADSPGSATSPEAFTAQSSEPDPPGAPSSTRS